MHAWLATADRRSLPLSTRADASASDRAKRCVIFVNEAAGGAVAARQSLGLKLRLHEAQCEASVRRVFPAHLPVAVRAELGKQPTLLVIGGGDGSVRAVASAVAGTEHVLGVLPLGTMNRFARSIGIPANLDEAIATFGTGSMSVSMLLT